MLSTAARSGLAPPKLRPFDAGTRPCARRCSSPSLSPVNRRARRRAENGGKEEGRKSRSLPTTALGGGDDDDPAGKNPRGQKAQAVLDSALLPTQEAAYDALARIAIDLLDRSEREKNSSKRVVVGLAGGPGSGKSTAAAAVVGRVNALWRQRQRERQRMRRRGEEEYEDEEKDVAAVLPMDGFHLTRAQLAASVDPPPQEMLARRGAPWTFDAEAFVDKVREVVEAGAGGGEGEAGDGDGDGDGKGGGNKKKTVVLAPSFDHGVGDPVPDAVAIEPAHRLVLVEGNYLLLPREPWSRLVGESETSPSSASSPPPPFRPLFDQTWFLDVGLDDAMRRVRRRQVADGVPEEVSRARVEANDRPNGILVAATRERADLVVRGDLPL